MPNRIAVLLADDHALVRRGFRRILEDDADLVVVGEASDGDEAIRLARELNPDVVVMDYAMPGTSGLAATRAILERAPDTAILLLSMHAEEALVRIELRRLHRADRRDGLHQGLAGAARLRDGDKSRGRQRQLRQHDIRDEVDKKSLTDNAIVTKPIAGIVGYLLKYKVSELEGNETKTLFCFCRSASVCRFLFTLAFLW